jgi:hypothetical protein
MSVATRVQAQREEAFVAGRKVGSGRGRRRQGQRVFDRRRRSMHAHKKTVAGTRRREQACGPPCAGGSRAGEEGGRWAREANKADGSRGQRQGLNKPDDVAVAVRRRFEGRERGSGQDVAAREAVGAIVNEEKRN